MVTTLPIPHSLYSSKVFLELQNENRALHEAFRAERLARKAAENKIIELQDEIVCLKQSRNDGIAHIHQQLTELLLTNNDLSKQLSRLIDTNQHLSQQVGELKQANEKLSQKVANTGITLAWFCKQYFGQKSESKPVAAVHDISYATENDIKRSRGQQPGKGNGHGRTDRSHLQPEEEFVDIPDCKCDVCGKPYYELRETDDSELLEIDVKAHRRIHKRRRYVSRCLCKGKQLHTAPAPVKLYPRTNIGNTLWAYLLLWRYMHGVPVHRILQNLSLHKLPLSAGTVAGGFQKIEKLLDLLYNKTIAHCQSSNLWHADETSWRVFEENNGTRSKKHWWFWLIASDDAVVYILDKTRSKAIPNGFFTASTGVLMTDRLASYKDLPATIQNVWCWVHVKRDFIKIFEGAKELRNWAKDWLTEIGQLFALNHKRIQAWQLNQLVQFQEAQIAVEQHISKLKELRIRQFQDPASSRPQKKVLLSMENHWQGLTLFLTDPRIPLTNNRAERLIRPIVISRKNSYGSGKEWSGMLAAKLFTILQTWLANGLDPQKLLLEYLNECSKNKGKPPPDVSSFLPWLMSEERKQEFILPQNIKRPA